MLGPAVDAVAHVRIGATDVSSLHTIIELGGRKIGKVAETVPLRSTLGVQNIDVIVGVTICQSLDFVLESLAPKGGLFRYIKRETIERR